MVKSNLITNINIVQIQILFFNAKVGQSVYKNTITKWVQYKVLDNKGKNIYYSPSSCDKQEASE